MADDSTAPATKQDIGLLMEEMGKLHSRFESMENRIGNIKMEFREELLSELKEYIDKKSQETHDYFNFYTGKLYKDFLGMTQDEIQTVKDKNENHEVRITTLEQEVEALTTS